ncbi:MAG: hypothetical protein JXQ93_04085 [Flavobacteriaceae bacterium]
MKIFLTLITLFLSLAALNAQKKISVFEFKGKTMIAISKKKGAKPKNRKVDIGIYYLTYEETEGDLKFIQFIKYTETYKKKKIKEFIYDTGVLTNRRYANSRVKKTVDSYQSTTNFKSLCCVYNYKSDNYVFKNDGLKIISTEKNKIHEGINISTSFFNPIPDITFEKYLKSKNISSDVTKELKSLKEYADNKFGDRGKYEDLITKLSEKNKRNSQELKKWMPRFIDYRATPHIISRDLYITDDTLKFIFLKEKYNWKDEFSNEEYSDRLRYENSELLVKYPENSPYHGEVYLRTMNDEGFLKFKNEIDTYPYTLLEVYKSKTKNPLPYKRLLIKVSNSDLKIYGSDGKINNELNDIHFTGQFKKLRSNILKSFQLSAKANRKPKSKYESALFYYYYVNKIVNQRPAYYKAYYSVRRQNIELEKIAQKLRNKYKEWKY